MTVCLLGGRGRLGQAIAAEYNESELKILARSTYEDWSLSDAADDISRYFEKYLGQIETILVASGLLDPRISKDDLFRINYLLPKNLIEGVGKLGIKVITFGTVMEGLLRSQNPYIQSKTALGEFVGSVASATRPAIHVQIHTLYGIGSPSPFMFLGQILQALRDNAPFKMTSGRQLREYHHLLDEARAIKLIAKFASPGLINLSHGKPVSLKAIAKNIFQAMKKEELLHIGALTEPIEENYESILEPTHFVQQVQFRDSIPEIVRYIKECYPPYEACGTRAK